MLQTHPIVPHIVRTDVTNKGIGKLRRQTGDPVAALKQMTRFIPVPQPAPNNLVVPLDVLDSAASQAATKAGKQQQLSNADKNKKLFITVHHPPFSLDSAHGGTPDILNAIDRAIVASARTPDVVLSGHVHNYQRSSRGTVMRRGIQMEHRRSRLHLLGPAHTNPWELRPRMPERQPRCA